MTRWADAIRVAADYTVGTVIVLAHLVLVGMERRARAKPQLLGA